MHKKHKRDLAHAYAMTLLAGDWSLQPMFERTVVFFGSAPEGVLWLLRALLRRFPKPPRDELSALVLALYRAERFQRWATPPNALHLRRLLIDAPQMAEARWPVRTLHSLRDVADFLHLPTTTLDWFADRRGYETRARPEWLRRYRYRWVSKRSGGQRLIEMPIQRLKAAQRPVLDEILAKIPAHDAAHGFVEGRSVRSFAEPHVGAAIVLRLDLVDFFASVKPGRVYGIFRSAGYAEEAALTLSALCLNRTPREVFAKLPATADASELHSRAALRQKLSFMHLPQGAPTSPALANLAAHELDVRLSALSAKFGARYTRYADDLAFSGGELLRKAAQQFQAHAAGIAIDCGFQVNFRKARHMRRSVRQRVAGVVINQKLNVARADYDELKATLWNCVKQGPESQNRARHPHFREHLRGRIAWVESLNLARGAKLRTLYEQIRWTA